MRLRSLTVIGFAAIAVPVLAAAGSGVILECGPVRQAPQGEALQAEARQAEARFYGEYGLWVLESDDSLEVRWITRESGAGYLVVLVDGRPVFEAETEPGASHGAAFARPAALEVTLRYGGVGDPQEAHETVIYFDLPGRPIQTEFGNVDTIFAVGDVHGEYDALTELLRNAGLIGDDGRWTGGRSYVVLLGDLLDRGPDVVKTLWFLFGLERDVARRGGRVQVLLRRMSFPN
jgi:hypothetical protein